MKDIFDHLLKALPQPMVLACVAVGIVFFAIHYHYSYQSYGDTFRDNKFRSVAVLILAVAIVYSLNTDTAKPSATAVQPVLIVPLFQNDADDKCRAPFVAMIEARLDETLSRSGTVQRVRSFVSDEGSARNTMHNYGAAAILYDASVSPIADDKVVCFKVLTADTGSLARLPPVPLTSPLEHIDRLVIQIAGAVSSSRADADRNPLLKRLTELERRLDRLTSLVESRHIQPATGKQFPEYAKRYAVVIGIDKFAGSPTELRFAKSDATQVDSLLRQSYAFDTTVLLDAAATKSAIKKSISELEAKCKPGDLFVFYFGGNIAKVPAAAESDAKAASLVPYDFHSNMFSTLELIEDIKRLPAKHKLLLVDGCYATSGLISPAASSGVEADPKESVLEFFGACRANQVAMEDAKGGVFTQAIIRTLRAAATDSGSGIWMGELLTRVQAQVSENNQGQTPELIRLSGVGSIAWVPTPTHDAR